MGCTFPSSLTVKSARLSPCTGLPFASVTVTSTTVSRAVTLIVGTDAVCAVVSACCAAPARNPTITPSSTATAIQRPLLPERHLPIRNLPDSLTR